MKNTKRFGGMNAAEKNLSCTKSAGLRILCTIALIAVIGFSFAACDNGSSPSRSSQTPDSGNKTPDSGNNNVTIYDPSGTWDFPMYGQTGTAIVSGNTYTFSVGDGKNEITDAGTFTRDGNTGTMRTSTPSWDNAVVGIATMTSNTTMTLTLVSPSLVTGTFYGTKRSTSGNNQTPVEISGMVWIPGGTFVMGSPTSEPDRFSDETQHQVTLTGFYMGKYPVTQTQYQAVMGSNPSSFTTPVSPETSTDNRPVECVSWYDALVFCNKLSIKEGLSPAYRINESTNPDNWGTVPTSSSAAWNAVKIVAGSKGYRLPTEAQWEYACRAGTTTAYNTGATISDNTGWYYGNSESKTHEVGGKPANAWGLYDMHGNVWEWCWDWYETYASGVDFTPLGVHD